MSRKKAIYASALLAVLFNLVCFPYRAGVSTGRHLIIEPWITPMQPDWFRLAVWFAIIAIVTAIARMLFARGPRRGEVVQGNVLPISR